MGRRYFIAGGAGFIGSHFVDRLLSDSNSEVLTIFDNFSSGRQWHYESHASDPRLRVVGGDIKDFSALRSALEGHCTVIHLASNPDIARAATEPDIDFREGTYLTNQILEAMRFCRVKTIIYASGSGVYGDVGSLEVDEDYAPMRPISTYGASKLAGEALISSYCHMFGLRGLCFRFANVVGPRQTHGVVFDFIRKLLKDDSRLEILGDGSQSKSYIAVSDVVSAVMSALDLSGDNFDVYNVATDDYISVLEIADLTLGVVLPGCEVDYVFSGGDRGWRGDVPVVRLDTARIKNLGWRASMNTREALRGSAEAILADFKAGRIS